MFHRIEEALEDLKQGKVVIVCDDENRENEGDFIALAEYITPETINFMITHGRGLVCVPITEGYAERLQLEPMVAHNTDSHHTAFTVSIDHVSTTTGISAHERATTIREMLNPASKVLISIVRTYLSINCERRWCLAPGWSYRSCCRFSTALRSRTSWRHL